MNRSILVLGSVLAVVIACTDSPTSPLSADQAARFSHDGSEHDPPPPPMDTGMVAFGEGSSEPLFRLGVTYFYNRTGNNAWLTFDESNARVHATNNKTTAKGTLAVEVDGGVWSANLSRDISAASLRTFGTCKWECSDLDINGTFQSAEGGKRPMALTLSMHPRGRGEVVPPAADF